MRRYALSVLLLALMAIAIDRSASQVADPNAPYEMVLPSVVRITVKGTTSLGEPVNQSGTGFFVGEQGHIVTAFHVVGKNRPNGVVVEEWKTLDLQVETVTDKKVLAQPVKGIGIIGKNLDHDIAVLRMPGGPYPAVACRKERIGLSWPVKGIGWQSGANQYNPIAGKTEPGEPSKIGDRYKIKDASQPGYSGGPIFTDDGVVVAVITSGQGGQIAPGGETYATAIEWALQLIPIDSKCRLTAYGLWPQGEHLIKEKPEPSKPAVAWSALKMGTRLSNRTSFPIPTYTTPDRNDRSIDIQPRQTVPPSRTNHLVEKADIGGETWFRFAAGKPGQYAHVPAASVYVRHPP